MTETTAEPRAKFPTAKELLARYGLSPKKSLGQNFLVDPRAQERIVAAADIGPNDVVVEIGAGLGALTARLVERAKQVIAIDRDSKLVEVLRAELGSCPNLEIVLGDALDFYLKAAASAAGQPLVVIGNLPYVVTPPGSRVYGRLSVMVQQAASAEILFHVGAGAFLPPPAVTSTVFCLRPRETPLADVADPALFARVVREAFGARRKMLRRALEPEFGERAAQALAAANIVGTKRAEELAVADFARLANALASFHA